MTMQFNIGEAKTRLSELVAASLRGEEVILAKAGMPVVRLTVIPEAAADIAQREIAARAAAMRASYGSLKARFGPMAGDLIVEPAYTDEEIAGFSKGLGG